MMQWDKSGVDYFLLYRFRKFNFWDKMSYVRETYSVMIFKM